jgi:hypothetical protein
MLTGTRHTTNEKGSRSKAEALFVLDDREVADRYSSVIDRLAQHYGG